MMKKFGILNILFLFLFCTMNPLGNGGTTEVDNAKIIGTIFKVVNNAIQNPDTVPIPNAMVILRSLRHTPDTLHTNHMGEYKFLNVDTGRYWLEARSEDSLGNLWIKNVAKDDSIVKDKHIVGVLGGLSGVLSIDSTVQNPDIIYQNTTIFIPELSTTLTVDNAGTFYQSYISPFSNYSLIVINDMYEPINDTMKIAVLSGAVSFVENTNNPPLFTHDASVMNGFAENGIEYRDTVHAIDTDGDSLFFEIIEGHMAMTLQDSVLIWIPTKGCCKQKNVRVTIQVRDDRGGFDTISWIIYKSLHPLVDNHALKRILYGKR